MRCCAAVKCFTEALQRLRLVRSALSVASAVADGNGGTGHDEHLDHHSSGTGPRSSQHPQLRWQLHRKWPYRLSRRGAAPGRQWRPAGCLGGQWVWHRTGSRAALPSPLRLRPSSAARSATTCSTCCSATEQKHRRGKCLAILSVASRPRADHAKRHEVCLLAISIEDQAVARTS